MKSIAKYKDRLTVKASSRSHNITMDLASPISADEGMSPGELLLNSLAGCKIISFVSLAKKQGLELEDLIVEITGETSQIGVVEETKMPIKAFDSIHTVYKIKSKALKEEVEKCIRLADELCTVGNSLSDKIKKTNEVIIEE